MSFDYSYFYELTYDMLTTPSPSGYTHHVTDKLKNYAQKLGVDTDELILSQPDSGEQALDIANMLIRSQAIDLVVVDSVAALVPQAELDGEMTDMQVGMQARLMSKAFDLKQFELAKQYGKECVGVSKIKRLCSQNKLLFYLFIAMKHLRRSL